MTPQDLVRERSFDDLLDRCARPESSSIASAVGTLIRDAEKARVFGALFRKPPPRRFGRYLLLDVLGHGGMGWVLKGYDEALDRSIALKVLHTDQEPVWEMRLRREAQALARIVHPNVVRVFEVGDVDGLAYVAMELLDGRTLRQWHQQRSPQHGWRESVAVYLQAAQGLAAAHVNGLLHRDFKPSNCMLDERSQVRVVDFGLVCEIDSRRSVMTLSGSSRPARRDDALGLPLTKPGQSMGTPAYMPPEQIRGQIACPRSDQFSFCVALYESVYGERPFEGATMVALERSIAAGRIRPEPPNTDVPARLRRLLVRGLSARPQDRWPSMEVVVDELLAILL